MEAGRIGVIAPTPKNTEPVRSTAGRARFVFRPFDHSSITLRMTFSCSIAWKASSTSLIVIVRETMSSRRSWRTKQLWAKLLSTANRA